MLRGIQVDLKPNPVTVHNELDHAPAPCKRRHVAYRQHARAAKRRQNAGQLRFSCGADEKNAARGCIFHSGKPLCHHGRAANHLASQRVIQRLPERVLTQHAHVEGLAGRRLDLPVGEPAEV